MAQAGVEAKRPKYKGAYEHRNGEISQEGKDVLVRVDQLLKNEERDRVRRMMMTMERGEIRRCESLLTAETVRCYLGDDREVMSKRGPMQTSVWFLLDGIGVEPIWFRHGDTADYVLGRLVPFEAGEVLVREAEVAAEKDWMVSRKVLPRSGSTFFRAINSMTEKVTHILVRRKWTSTNGYLDLPSRPEKALFYESKRSNTGKNESLNTMCWGRDYYALALDDEVRKIFFGDAQTKTVAGGGGLKV